MGAPSLDELNKIAEPLLAPEKSLNLGPFIVAVVLDTLLCGVLLMQCGAYVSQGRTDRPYLRGIVAYVLVMNLITQPRSRAITIYTWAWVYDLFVYNFGTYGLFLSLKYLSQYYVLDSMTVIVVQGFFAMRAWRVANRSIFVLVLIGTFALAAFGGGVAVKVMFTELGSTLHAGDVKIPAYIWLFSTVAADLLITSIIMKYLLTGKTGQPSTDHALSRLARVTFESQLPPTLIAIGLAVEYTIQSAAHLELVRASFFFPRNYVDTRPRREALKSVSGTAATDDGDIEFAKRSHNTFWLTSRFAPTSNDGHAPRPVKGDTHRHTQFTIMPEPRTRRVKTESIDTISFKGVDLGPDEDDAPDTTQKVSEVNLPAQGEITELDISDDPNGRPRRGGGQSKLASMGMAGGIAGMEGERRRD
ncbi:hypothetical protein FRC10_012209 [Ceratobasidium sp. 414]|nr:hypothetical protein FRC10_012209 [Ceratobasidium sp. 414]